MEIGSILGLSGGGILFVVSMLIKIPKIEINIWQWLFRAVGNAFNHDMLIALDENKKKMDVLTVRMDEHEAKDEERHARQCRTQIVRFGDELLDNKTFSKDHFDTILLACDEYEDYCSNHRGFKNNVATETIKAIKQEYALRWKEHSFAEHCSCEYSIAE